MYQFHQDTSKTLNKDDIDNQGPGQTHPESTPYHTRFGQKKFVNVHRRIGTLSEMHLDELEEIPWRFWQAKRRVRWW